MVITNSFRVILSFPLQARVALQSFNQPNLAVQMLTQNHWRFLDTGEMDAFSNMATDEAILWNHIQNLVPETLRVYMWKPSAVSIGFFQSLDQEVNINECKAMGVDVVRRITGGGAVYHESQGELTYSLVVREENLRNLRAFTGIKGSYEIICNGIIKGLEKIGIRSEFKPINDILVNGKKISGNAQTRRMGVILQHGTILLKTNIPTMFRVLKVTKEKVSDKALRAVEERVTTIYEAGMKGVTLDTIKNAIREGFSEALGVELQPNNLTVGELEKAEELRHRFSSSVWNNRR